MDNPSVGIVMGGDSDLPVMRPAAQALTELGIGYEVRVISAHRTPQATLDYASSAAERGLSVLIAGAGGAAHLPGMLAAATHLPVIGVPVPTAHLQGLDSLLLIVQMPAGIPVATVAIGAARNAALLAARILALSDPALQRALRQFQTDLAAAARAADHRVRQSFTSISVGTRPGGNMLDGKRLIITGVVTTDSIAFAVADRAQQLGADIILTAFPRDRAQTEGAARTLSRQPDIVNLDVTQDDNIQAVTDYIRGTWGAVDGALHAIAYAPQTALAGDFLDASAADVNRAFQTSTYTYASLARMVKTLAAPQGAALVGLTFDAAGAWPGYNWMGVCKAALEAVNRYLARDLGACNIRTNLIAAGPLHTRAAGGSPSFGRLTDAWDRQAPLPWDSHDAAPVADTACFLLSDFSRATTGEVLHVDGGYHAIAAPLGQRQTPTATDSELPGPSSLEAATSTRQQLMRAFKVLATHGIEARPALGDDATKARTALRQAIKAQFPHADASYVFWSATDDRCFDKQGMLQQPLVLHYSNNDCARAIRHALKQEGLPVREGSESLTLEVAAA
jgi:enoyl ACP reductase